MPELKEVFEMVTKQTEPEVDSWKEQEQRQRLMARNRRIGAFALVAAIVAVAAVIAISAMRPEAQDRTGGPPDQIREDATHVVVDLETGTTSTLPASLDGGSSYVLSPDGDELAYAPSLDDPIGDDNRLHVYIGNVDGTDVRRVTPLSNGMDEFNPRWTPEGQIVFQGRNRFGEEIGDLYLLDPVGGSTTKLTNLPVQSSHHWFMSASVRPDGQVILFNLPRGPLEDQVWDLWTIPATGGEPQLVRRDAAHGSYSPDGTTIAYVGRPRFESGNGAFAGTSIWLADADGKHPRLLVMASGEQEELGWPRWSPDGTRIAYTDESAVFVIDVETGQIAKVLDGGSPEWIDDHALIFERD
jgi:Tol biopolymer transport system component